MLSHERINVKFIGDRGVFDDPLGAVGTLAKFLQCHSSDRRWGGSECGNG